MLYIIFKPKICQERRLQIDTVMRQIKSKEQNAILNPKHINNYINFIQAKNSN